MKAMETQTTDNFRKHTSKNPIQKFLINNFYKSLISTVQDLKVDSVLDVGCGEGFTLQKLYENKIGRKLEGIDYQQIAIELGKKLHPNLVLKQGDIYKLPYKDNSFDLIICTEVLEHLKDPKQALKEISRASKKYLVLSVPNEPFFMMANFLRGKNIARLGNDIEHVQNWTSKGFQRFVKSQKEPESQRVRILRVRHPFPWTVLLLEKS